MGKVIEHKVEAERLGAITDRILRQANPEGFIEFQLRQAIADAVKSLGVERAREIFNQEAA